MPGSDYVPALRFHALTRLYDPLMAWTLGENRFKSRLVTQAAPRAGQRVLDLGCGTGTLTLLLKRAAPEARVAALDADPEALHIAKSKADAEGLAIEFEQSLAVAAPFGPGSFDRVVSSLFFHHLPTDAKQATLGRVREWLAPGGELHVADWGQARSTVGRLAFLPVQLLDGFEATSDNVQRGLEPFLGEAGFSGVEETHRHTTLFGTVSLYRARV